MAGMRVLKWISIAVLTLIVLLALLVAFGMNTLRGPISKAITKATGRELVIEGNLQPVWTWVHPRFRAERVRFANADWAQAEQFFTAESVEASIKLMPLLRGKVVIPEVHLEQPVLALEQDEEGRKNWILEKHQEK